MNRLVGVLFVTVVGCTPVVAQQSNNPFDAQVTRAVRAARQGQEAPAAPSFVFNPTFKWPLELPLSRTSAQQRTQPQPLIVMPPPAFIIKDGALYIDIGNRVLVPAPGGGASGCFDRNLHERIEKLKTAIEALPPRPATNPPRQ